MREAIGLGMALEQFGSTFFSNGTNIGGVAKHPGKLSKQGHDNLIDSINKAYQGLGNSHKLLLLEENMDFMPVTMPLADAQYIELRRFQLEEIARIFRVPLHLLQDLSRSTNNNIEHQSIDFVMHTIRPWLVRIEQAINMQLFSEQERKKYFVEFSVDALLRGDILSRFQAYSIAKQNGIYNANEIRELENRNPYDGGDKYTIQLNMQDVGQLGKLVGDSRELVIKDNEIRVIPKNEIAIKPVELNINEKEARSIRSANTRTRLAKAYSGLFENVVTRLIKRERAEVMSIANSCFTNRDNQLFGEKLDKFYEDFKEFLNIQTKPVISTYADAIAIEAADEVELKDYDIDRFTDDYQKAFDYRYSKEHKGRITNIVAKAIENNKNPVEVLEKEFDSWEEKKPEQVSKEETVKIAGAVSLAVYKIAGVTKLVWRNTGSKSCPYCEALDGKIVGIQESFIPVGSQFKPDGADLPLKIDSPKMHAPLHGGCVCQISPSW
ncbi:MAG TPA: phage portal protein [Clostridiales bacterium]|nr:phage portal protein [Clostridiales bacterium]